MIIKEKKIVVTGAAGFIGSNLTDSLLEQGAEVIGIDNLFNGKMENLDETFKHDNYKFYKGDIRDLIFWLFILSPFPMPFLVLDSYF